MSSASNMTLRKIMDEPVLFRGFSDFCKVQHAYENLEFWLAVDSFRDNGKELQRDAASATSPLSPSNRKSIRRTFWNALTSQGLQRIGSQTKMDEPKDVLAMATKVYETFLAPNAEKWVCVDQAEQEEIKKKLDSGVVDYKLFDVVQRQVFVNMEKDLLPRFARTFEAEETVFQSAAQARGSVRFVPDQKLRATLVKATASTD